MKKKHRKPKKAISRSTSYATCSSHPYVCKQCIACVHGEVIIVEPRKCALSLLVIHLQMQMQVQLQMKTEERSRTYICQFQCREADDESEGMKRRNGLAWLREGKIPWKPRSDRGRDLLWPLHESERGPFPGCQITHIVLP